MSARDHTAPGERSYAHEVRHQPPSSAAIDVWRIEKLVPGGAGMARLPDGRIGFAEGALPNERIAVEVSKSKKGYVEARSFRLLESAPERVEPPCKLAGVCGGCDFLHVEYRAQLALKSAMLREALERTGGFRDLPRIEVEASPRALGYRSRIRLHIDAAGRAGFHARKSHRVIEVESCVVARGEIDRALAVFRAVLGRHPDLAVRYGEAELRAPPHAERVSLRLVPRSRGEGRLANALVEELEADFHVSVAGSGTEALERWKLDDETSLLVSAGGFVQVNWEMNQRIVRALVEGALSRGAASFVDLHAGAGNFTLPLLARGLSGAAVESQPEAVALARRALSEHGLGKGSVHLADAADALRGPLAGRRFDLAVLDPPRSGAHSLIEPLVCAAPGFIAYCSCDPVTLARDLRDLVKGGYALEAVQGFDMFPGTHHVEALVWLRRRDAADGASAGG